MMNHIWVQRSTTVDSRCLDEGLFSYIDMRFTKAFTEFKGTTNNHHSDFATFFTIRYTA